MAFYVMLTKVNEDEEGVIYNFGSDSQHIGKIHLDKHNGIVKEIDDIDNENHQHTFVRAGIKLRQHWKSGYFPERTCWAS